MVYCTKCGGPLKESDKFCPIAVHLLQRLLERNIPFQAATLWTELKTFFMKAT